MSNSQRVSVEQRYDAELTALRAGDEGDKPAGWQLSPRAVVTYLMGGKAADGTLISPKYIGKKRLIETAVATLATDRALLLLGIPGTAKSWVSQHLAAAISGDSMQVVRCTAGIDESQIRYGWNYAQMVVHGVSRDALVPTPLFRAMAAGTLCRIEELTHLRSEIQDALIAIVSERVISIEELDERLYSQRGFNIIATASLPDDRSSALSPLLKRWFNIVILPPPDSLEEEVKIVQRRVAEMGHGLDLPFPGNAAQEILRVVTIFRELRDGCSSDGKILLKAPAANLSTAEAIGVVVGGMSECHFFGNGCLKPHDLSASLVGAIIKDPVRDKPLLEEYLETVLKKRPGYDAYYHAIQEML